jgi:hypothetical protein
MIGSMVRRGATESALKRHATSEDVTLRILVTHQLCATGSDSARTHVQSALQARAHEVADLVRSHAPDFGDEIVVPGRGPESASQDHNPHDHCVAPSGHDVCVLSLIMRCPGQDLQGDGWAGTQAVTEGLASERRVLACG